MRPEFVYLIRFTSGTVKVGHTKRIDSRIKEHEKHARAHGVTIAETWHSETDNADGAESELMSLARSHGGQSIDGNPEFFTGVKWPALLRSARFRFDNHGAAWHEAMAFEGTDDPWARKR